jgi:hypothetical protein
MHVLLLYVLSSNWVPVNVIHLTIMDVYHDFYTEEVVLLFYTF